MASKINGVTSVYPLFIRIGTKCHFPVMYGKPLNEAR